jgi:hypothetical protein
VPRIAMFFGVLLTVLGIGLYAMSDADHKSPTALIPCGFGLALVLLGQLGQASDQARKHTMHAAAVIGLVGLVAGIVLTIIDLNKRGTETPPLELAMYGKAAFGIICGVFLVLCVKSFIDARKARKQNQANSPT